MATPILIYGLVSLSAFVALMTPAPRGTLFGPMVIAGIGALYGAVAILQLQYDLIKSWRPEWGQGFTLAWFGGWALLTIGQLIREFRSGGLSAVGEFLPYSIGVGVVFLFPWLLAVIVRAVVTTVRARSRRVS